MTEVDMAQEIAAVETDLLELIQDDGLTEIRLAQSAPNIMRQFSVQSPEFVKKRIEGLIMRQGSDKYTVALKHALGIAVPVEGGLTERRKWLRTHPDFDVSEDTLRRWERKAMPRLASSIIRAALVPSDNRQRGGAVIMGADVPASVDQDRRINELAGTVDMLSAKVRSLQQQVDELRRAIQSRPAQD